MLNAVIIVFCNVGRIYSLHYSIYGHVSMNLFSGVTSKGFLKGLGFWPTLLLSEWMDCFIISHIFYMNTVANNYDTTIFCILVSTHENRPLILDHHIKTLDDIFHFFLLHFLYLRYRVLCFVIPVVIHFNVWPWS